MPISHNIAQAAVAEAPNFCVEHSLTVALCLNCLMLHRTGPTNPYLRRSAPSARTTSPLPRNWCCAEVPCLVKLQLLERYREL